MEQLRGENPTIDRFLLDAMAKEIRRMSTLLSEALYLIRLLDPEGLAGRAR
jgi:hypothetical protein